MKLILTLSFAVLCINSFAQETLQSVTDRGTTTNKEIQFRSVANPNKYAFVGGYPGYARIGAYDITTGYDNLFIEAANISVGHSAPRAVFDITTPIPNGVLGAVFGRLPEGDDTGNGTFLGIQGHNTNVIGGESFSIVHNFYGQTNSAINFHRGGDRIGGFISFSTFSNQERMRIDPYGNVGIGTITPSTKLEVSTSTDYDQMALTKNTVEYYKGAGVIFRNLVDDGSTTEIGGLQARLLNGSTGNVAGSLSFYTKSGSSKVEAITIKPEGNVGIGTVNPTEKLAVNGKIRAKEIKVEASNWPDYVFEEGYKVGTLEGLESYIKANKRLPEMPAAKEIETNGLVLGEVVKLQQKKIEELTLHLIEKDKELRNIAAKQKEMETLLKKLTEKK